MKNYILAIACFWAVIATGLMASAYSELGEERERNETLESTLAQVREDYRKNTEKMYVIQAKIQADEQEIQKVREQANKDITRVESVIIKKAKLYEKLVNKDFEKSQNELVIISE